ncbi:MAG: hypothetical protein K2N84_05890, partial [Clostridia bacterium]|nr:hypothetical protein [Clostridia bacterium]
TFTGTRAGFAEYKCEEYFTVDVYIDGKLVAADVDLSADKNVGTIAYVYSDDALESGEHTLKIVGKSGSFNIDSFVYWN